MLLKLKSTFQRTASLAIGFGFKNKQTLELLAPEIQTEGLFKPQSSLFFEIPKQLNDF